MIGRVIRHVRKGAGCRLGKVLSSHTFLDKPAGGFPSSVVATRFRAYLAFNPSPSKWRSLETYIQGVSKSVGWRFYRAASI